MTGWERCCTSSIIVRKRLIWTAAVMLLVAQLAGTRAAGAAKDSWVEVRSPHFTVLSNAGEKQGRTIADQFEQFREMFVTSFPKFRVDLGKPLVIFALKNEDSMKLFLPGYWEVKGHTHPAGIYVQGEEKHFVALRTDLQGDNPYEIVYHEYTHAIMGLNFRGLPLWLSEGLAEFYGNSVIHDGYVEIGKIAPWHLQTLQESKLIPIDTLLQVDANSPYYSEQNRTTVFYAESWTMVHYLLLDAEARKRDLLQKFLNEWDASGNQVDAAQKTFGDLKKFGGAMEAYCRRREFYESRVNTKVHGDPKSYASRVLPAAEADALRGEFYVYTRRPKEAREALNTALREAPLSPLVHEGLGLLAYYDQDQETAESEFNRAIELNTTNYLSYFFSARSRIRKGAVAADDGDKAVADLEKAISMNPQFAPAYATLASLYSTNPKAREKALELGKKAIALEPGNLQYAVSYGYVLANMGQTAAAKVLAGRIEAAARTPGERAMAGQLKEVVKQREEYEARVKMQGPAPSLAAVKKSGGTPEIERSITVADPGTGASTSTTAASAKTPATAAPPPRSSSDLEMGARQYSLVGKITKADCAAATPGSVTLTINAVLMKFHYADVSQVQVTSEGKSAAAPACAAWKGQRAKVTFHPALNEAYDGELMTIQFF